MTSPRRLLLLPAVLTLLAGPLPRSAADPGDPLPRIDCPGSTAFVHAEGLSSPDGLVLEDGGALLVAEESAGRVSRIWPDGSWETWMTGLASPEGVALDELGRTLAVEDVENGRLLRREADGTTTVLASGLDAPEGVTCTPDGTIYWTESNVQFAGSPFEYRTRIGRLLPGGAPEIRHQAIWFWSYAGLALAPDGGLLFTNEASPTGTDHAVIRLEPTGGNTVLVATGLESPEGLRFGAGGPWPLRVAQESVGGGGGRVARVDSDGSWSDWAIGFQGIEDVTVDGDGVVYVSEDSTGLIIRLEPWTPTPTATPSPTPSPTVAVPVPAMDAMGLLLLGALTSLMLRRRDRSPTR